MSSYDRRFLYQQFFELQDRYSPEEEPPFVARESVRLAMGRRNEPAVWHNIDSNQSDIRPQHYILHTSPRSIMIDSNDEVLRHLRESMGYNIQNQRSQNPYTINDYETNFASRFSTELEKIVEKIRASDNRITGEFNLQPKPNKKTLSDPRLSPKEGTDNL